MKICWYCSALIENEAENCSECDVSQNPDHALVSGAGQCARIGKAGNCVLLPILKKDALTLVDVQSLLKEQSPEY